MGHPGGSLAVAQGSRCGGAKREAARSSGASPAWDIALGFLQAGQTEQAYCALLSNDVPSQELIRLMHRSGTCLHRVSVRTRSKLLRFCAQMLAEVTKAAQSNRTVGELLPWVAQATQMGLLSPGSGTDATLVDQLTRQLQVLSHSPYDVGAQASRLHAFLMLQRQHPQIV